MIKKRVKKYFTGGNTQDFSNLASGLSAGATGDYGQLASSIMTTGSRAGELSNSGYATGAQKALLGLGGAGGIVGSTIANSIVGGNIEKKQQMHEGYNNDIAQRDAMFNMDLGGKLPGNLSNELLELGGFTHDDPNPENINNGVPLKDDGQDVHAAQKDETFMDGYVYSNDLLVQDGKYKNKTFAEATKRIEKAYKPRMNDKIFKGAYDRDMQEMADKNDEVREQTELSDELEMRCGGKLYYKGGKIKEGEYDVDDLDLDEIDYLNKQGYDIEIL